MNNDTHLAWQTATDVVRLQRGWQRTIKAVHLQDVLPVYNLLFAEVFGRASVEPHPNPYIPGQGLLIQVNNRTIASSFHEPYRGGDR